MGIHPFKESLTHHMVTGNTPLEEHITLHNVCHLSGVSGAMYKNLCQIDFQVMNTDIFISIFFVGR